MMSEHAKKHFESNELSHKDESPSVGIFWFYDGSPVFVHAVPVKEGLRYDKAITGIKDHADYWEELKSKGQLGILPENLREEYFSIPRGRVVYHEDTGFFTVYHGNNLKKRDLQKVAAVFCLPKDKTRAGIGTPKLPSGNERECRERPERGKICETDFERVSEQLCCEGVRVESPQQVDCAIKICR